LQGLIESPPVMCRESGNSTAVLQALKETCPFRQRLKDSNSRDGFKKRRPGSRGVCALPEEQSDAEKDCS